MIEISTLFLALVFGPQRIDVDVSPDVAAVEIVVDGQAVARLDSPPWAAIVDLGSALRTHRLEAIAFDDAGREIDRDQQFLNLGHRREGGGLELLEGKDGRPEAVSLRWESIGQRQPVQVQVYFDGEPLAHENSRRISLPSYEAADFHFVSAEFEFHDGTIRRSELGFGGRLGLEIASDLTTVVVSARGDAKPPKVQDLATAFRLQGNDTPLEVHGVEKGRAEVILVRDDGVQRDLDRLVGRITGGYGSSLRLQRTLARRKLDSVRDLRLFNKTLQEFARLPRKTTLRLLAPRAALLLPAGVSRDMFLISPPLDVSAQGFLYSAVQEPPQRAETQLASAVALAGKMAQGSQRPRAVLLILGRGGDDAPRDSGDVTPRAARAYLEDLGVPLFVWGFEPVPKGSGWGEVHSLGPADDQDDLWEARKRFEVLTSELGENLRQQRLVWVKGSHLPREIELAPGAENFMLVGRTAPDIFVGQTNRIDGRNR